jgi:hypothetical protein
MGNRITETTTRVISSRLNAEQMRQDCTGLLEACTYEGLLLVGLSVEQAEWEHDSHVEERRHENDVPHHCYMEVRVFVRVRVVQREHQDLALGYDVADNLTCSVYSDLQELLCKQ